MTIGIAHPGEMGASVAAAARRGGRDVVWASEGRGAATRERAEAADLRDLGTLGAVAGASEVLLSVCPPAAARDVAHAAASVGFRGVYVDCNAVSPETARDVGRIVESGGAAFVDGGIVGPAVRAPNTTRLYLSGEHAPRIAALFADTPLAAIALDGGPGAASALKVAYAAYTKGSAALLLAIRALARAEGVDAALLDEWKRSQPELPARSAGAARGTARRAWRFVGEMEEIAAAFAFAHLPDGFHRAAADLYRRLERYKDTPDPPSLEEVTEALRKP